MSKVSVVMPVYNGGSYLRESIESILEQSYRDFEFIIVNDGSTDNSAKLIQKYAEDDNRIIFINRKENRKLVYTLNEAIDAARGQYIARMDADDLSHPQRLEMQVSYLEENNLDIVGCNYVYINEHGKVFDSILSMSESDFITLQLCMTVPFSHGSVLLRKSLLTENAITYEECPTEDYLLYSRLVDCGARFGNVQEFLYSLRIHKESFTNTKVTYMLRSKFKIAKAFVNLNKKTAAKILNKYCHETSPSCNGAEKEVILLSGLMYFLTQKDIKKFLSALKNHKTPRGVYRCFQMFREYIKYA